MNKIADRCNILKKMIFKNGFYVRIKLIKFLGFFPGNFYFYKLAFIHRSAQVKLNNISAVDNERLEFLGDSILDAIASEIIYIRYPDKNEGYLSKVRSVLVNREALNQTAVNLGIPQFLSTNLNSNNNTLNPYGNALEALIGAIFLDKGYQKAKKFVLKKVIVDKHLDENFLDDNYFDYKSQIIEWGQKHGKKITFSVAKNPEDKKYKQEYISKLKIGKREMGSGNGMSIKEAEQNSSKQALSELERSI